MCGYAIRFMFIYYIYVFLFRALFGYEGNDISVTDRGSEYEEFKNQFTGKCHWQCFLNASEHFYVMSQMNNRRQLN